MKKCELLKILALSCAATAFMACEDSNSAVAQELSCEGESLCYEDSQADKIFTGEAAVPYMLKDSVYKLSNVDAYKGDFNEHEFDVSSYILFFATVDSAAVEGELLTMYFDGLWEQKNPAKYRYISVYYLPEDFDYNRAVLTGGEATLAFRAPVTIQNPNKYPDNDTTLYHSAFTKEIDDVIHTGLKWDGKHRKLMVVHATEHSSSTVLLSKRGGKSMFFKKAPTWAKEAYSLDQVGAKFEIPATGTLKMAPLYCSDEGILVTTEPGAISKEDVELAE